MTQYPLLTQSGHAERRFDHFQSAGLTRYDALFGARGAGNAATQVHHAYWRCGGMAARSAGAAGGDARYRMAQRKRSGALIIGTDPFLLGERDQLVRLAARYMLPTIYFLREFRRSWRPDELWS